MSPGKNQKCISCTPCIGPAKALHGPRTICTTVRTDAPKPVKYPHLPNTVLAYVPYETFMVHVWVYGFTDEPMVEHHTRRCQHVQTSFPRSHCANPSQDGRHVYVWLKPLKIVFCRTQRPILLKRGMLHYGHEYY